MASARHKKTADNEKGKEEKVEHLESKSAQSLIFKIKPSPINFTMRSLQKYLDKQYIPKDPADRNDVVMLMLLSDILYNETAEKYGAIFNCYVCSIENFSSFLAALSHLSLDPSKDINLACIFYSDYHHVAVNIRFSDDKFKVYIVDSTNYSPLNTVVIYSILNEILKISNCDPRRLEIFFMTAGIQRDDINCPFFALKTALTLSRTENLEKYIDQVEKKSIPENDACPFFLIDRAHTPAVLQRMNQLPANKFKTLYPEMLSDDKKMGKHGRTLAEHFHLFSKPQTPEDVNNSYIGHVRKSFLNKVGRFIRENNEDVVKHLVNHHNEIFRQRLDVQLKSTPSVKLYYKHTF